MGDMRALLGKIAPWIAAAAAGPAGLAMQAVRTAADALGASEGTVDAVAAAVGGAKPEQLLALRQAEIEFKARMQALGFESLQAIENIAAGDRRDARAMQISTRSWVPAALSIAVTLGYFAVLGGMMVGLLKVSDSQALLLMLGSLSTGWGVVMAYWFGTTSDSGRKTEMLAQAPPVNR